MDALGVKCWLVRLPRGVRAAEREPDMDVLAREEGREWPGW